MAYCRFRGAFTAEERKQVERAIGAVEGVAGFGSSAMPVWLVMRATPAAGTVYVGVRFRDGTVVREPALDALIDSLKALRHV